MTSSTRCDALVAGGGPAGSMLAVLLASAGRSVIMVERNREAQHKVCGEFLSPESLPLLRSIGVSPETLGAQTIRRLRIVARDVLAEIELPAPALSLTRRTLDEALLESARLAGANILRGYTVEQLCQDGLSWQARIVDSASDFLSIHGRDAFVATGKHELRGWARSTRGTQSNMVAMKMYFALAPPSAAALAGHIELVFFPGGYAGLQPVEGGAANLCALVTRKQLRALGSRWDALLEHMQHHAPALARSLNGAHQLLDHPLALSQIPYGFCTRDSKDTHGPWRIGDQAAVIPSFAGDGVSIALYTAQRAAELYLAGSTAADLNAEIRRVFKRRLTVATWLSRILVVLPSIARAVQIKPSLLEDIFTATRLPIAAAGTGGRRAAL